MPSCGFPEPYGAPPTHPSTPGTPHPSHPNRESTPRNRPTLHDRFRSCLALPAMPASVATARMHTRDLLLRWHMATISDDAGLVVTELLTNAIKATTPIPPQPRYADLYDRLEVVCLCLYNLTDELLIEVWDPEHEPPLRRDATPDDEDGRGLLLVDALTLAWGTRWPHLGGKIVWAALALHQPR
jgi:Anti-sigma regulatory factor (Ser/Thr protein kinase)